MPSQKDFNIKEHLIQDAYAMIRYALNSGKSLPASIIQTLEAYQNESAPSDIIDAEISQKPKLEELILIHDQLVKIVSPATPESIKYLQDEEEKRSFFGFFSKVSFIRQLGFATIFCFVFLLGLATMEEVSFSSEAFRDMSGWPMLANLLFLLAAAGLGASLHELWEARQYTTDRTFHPKYISSYWARFTLGLVAGLVIATLIPVEGSGDFMASLKRPTVAMLGGFSTSLVYKALNRLVELAEQFFGGQVKEVREAEGKAGKAKAELEKNNSKITRYITEARELLSEGADSEKIKEKLEKMLNSVLPASEEEKPLPAGNEETKSVGEIELTDEEYSEDEEKYREEEYHYNVNQPIENLKEPSNTPES